MERTGWAVLSATQVDVALLGWILLCPGWRCPSLQSSYCGAPARPVSLGLALVWLGISGLSGARHGMASLPEGWVDVAQHNRSL